MTPGELRPILAEYRTRVQPAWSKATAHPDHDAADGSPVGQCGVTSAWLQQRLREDHGGETLYCAGNRYPARREPGSDHCWLEHIGTNFVVIDLTADQYEGGQAVTCDAFLDLADRGIHYVTHESTPDPYGTDLQQRLALLESALS